ncbi:MAG TPA: hypothetical protein VFA59_09680 [Vicinamibacterales bacterium]|nr:hypothetical protein [Vicinamibacterales bacterium]
MVAVRYAALAALVFWIGALLNVVAAGALAKWSTPLVCGGVVLLGLFVMKFVGPPPRAFVPRAALAVLMIVSTVIGTPIVTLAVGAVLLFWYVYE